MTGVTPASRQALRTLLRRPLLSSRGESAEEYVRVQRHSEWLKQWLVRFPNWSLHIDGEVARLRKVPADLQDDTRPAIDRRSGTPFTKRRYALLCLTLAVLEQLDRQTTLEQIAERISEMVAEDRDLQACGLFFDLENHDQRRDLLHAVRFLEDVGALRKLDGDETQFQIRNDSTNGMKDVLYDINRHVLAVLLQGSRSASAIEASAIEASSQRYREAALEARAERLHDQPVPATEDERRECIRSRLVRTLLDDPILYFQDLDDEEKQYLEKNRSSLLREICEATGLIAEVRREGIALVDDAGDLTDIRLPDHPDPGPDNATVGHISLVLLQWLVETSGKKAAAIPVSAVEQYVLDLIRKHGAEWTMDIREPGMEVRLTHDALSRLRALRLIQLHDSGVVPQAAAGRYAKVLE